MFPPEICARIEKEFDSFCKRVIRNEAIDYYRKKNIQLEDSLDALPLRTTLTPALITHDKYPSNYYMFNLPNGWTTTISDELLGNALQKLPILYQHVILWAYLYDLSDQQISSIIGIHRRTVQRIRQRAFEQLRKNMGVSK